MATWCGSSWEDVNSSREQQMFRRGLALKRVLTGRYPPGPGGLGGILLGGWTGCIGWPGRQGLVWLHRSRLVGRRVIGVALGSFRTRSRVPVGFPARMVSLVPPSVGFPVPVARPWVSRVREPHDAPRSDASLRCFVISSNIIVFGVPYSVSTFFWHRKSNFWHTLKC